MKNKNQLFFVIGFLFSLGTMFVDRFIVTVPDWLAIVLGLLAILAFVACIITCRKRKS